MRLPRRNKRAPATSEPTGTGHVTERRCFRDDQASITVRDAEAARVPAGLWARIVQRLLALNAAIWHNWQIGAPYRPGDGRRDRRRRGFIGSAALAEANLSRAG
jgi:hypothetical protein